MISLDQKIAMFLDQATNAIHLRRCKAKVRRDGNWIQPELHLQIIACHVDVRRLV